MSVTSQLEKETFHSDDIVSLILRLGSPHVNVIKAFKLETSARAMATCKSGVQ